MGSIEPSPEQLQQLLAASTDSTPIVMINLLRYRDRAAYLSDSDAAPCSGREAYQRYGASVTPMVIESGGKILWFGNVAQIVIGPDTERWDDAVLVQYPSRQAFITMVTRPDYLAASVHRTAALADSRLIATATLQNFL
jgi:uncharacterized protein (DUF1330 family)